MFCFVLFLSFISLCSVMFFFSFISSCYVLFFFFLCPSSHHFLFCSFLSPSLHHVLFCSLLYLTLFCFISFLFPSCHPVLFNFFSFSFLHFSLFCFVLFLSFISPCSVLFFFASSHPVLFDSFLSLPPSSHHVGFFSLSFISSCFALVFSLSLSHFTLFCSFFLSLSPSSPSSVAGLHGDHAALWEQRTVRHVSSVTLHTRDPPRLLHEALGCGTQGTLVRRPVLGH